MAKKSLPAAFSAQQFKKGAAKPASPAPAASPIHYGGNISAADACDTFGNHRAK